MLAGFVDEAIHEYGRVFDLAEKRGSPRGQHFAATQLAALHWDCACEVEADLWLARARAIAASQPDLANDFGLSTLQMERSLFEGKFVEAQRLLRAMISAGPLKRNDICRRWFAQRALQSDQGSRIWIETRTVRPVVSAANAEAR